MTLPSSGATPPAPAWSVDALVATVRAQLTAAADPAKASAMAAYMKTAMPFYGVPNPGRTAILRRLKQEFPITDAARYQEAVLALWAHPQREEKYLAIALAIAWPAFVTREAMPLYERLIREGAWWDFVDDVAIRLVGKVWMEDRAWASPLMDAWIEDPDPWIRRAAIIGQIKHKPATDEARLFDYCRRRAGESGFFIRKAIGWALREYARTAPQAVREFLATHRAALSGLSYREAGRHL